MSKTKKSEKEVSNATEPSDCSVEGEAEETLESPLSEGDSESEATEEAPESAETEAQQEIEALKAEITQLNEKVESIQAELSSAQKDIGYAKAETQTAVRRGREDTARAVSKTKRDLISNLIEVADTFHMTTAEIAKTERTESTETVLNAVEMAINAFNKTLSKEGVEPLDPKDEIFDPNLHEAQVSVPTDEAEPNTVLEVLRIGYQMGDTLLRAPGVVVATAPEKPKDTSEETDSD